MYISTQLVTFGKASKSDPILRLLWRNRQFQFFGQMLDDDFCCRDRSFGSSFISWVRHLMPKLRHRQLLKVVGFEHVAEVESDFSFGLENKSGQVASVKRFFSIILEQTNAICINAFEHFRRTCFRRIQPNGLELLVGDLEKVLETQVNL